MPFLASSTTDDSRLIKPFLTLALTGALKYKEKETKASKLNFI